MLSMGAPSICRMNRRAALMIGAQRRARSPVAVEGQTRRPVTRRDERS
jgi:hypothetical protein